MKLRVWNNSDKFLDDCSRQLKEANILEAHRFIYLFFSHDDLIRDKNNEFSSTDVIIGKAIQVNMAISQGADNIEMSPMFRMNCQNSTVMSMTMYFYDVVFHGSIRNVNDGLFSMTNAISTSTMNDYDSRMAMSNGQNFYSKDIRDDPNKKRKLSNLLYYSAPNIPEPMYYSMMHMENEKDEIYCITSIDTSFSLNGYELIDDKTRISIMNMSSMDSMIPQLKNKMYDIRNMTNIKTSPIKMCDSTELSSLMLYNDVESMQNGYMYSYDSEIGRQLEKTSKSMIPFGEYQFKDKMVQDLERMMDGVESYGRSLEREFGSVRIIYTPLYFGDKVDIYFKDYKPDNQPIIKTNTNIDSGMKVHDEISHILTDISSMDEFDDTDDDEELLIKYGI